MHEIKELFCRNIAFNAKKTSQTNEFIQDCIEDLSNSLRSNLDLDKTARRIQVILQVNEIIGED